MLLDVATDKIPNWYILLASMALLTQKIILNQGMDFFIGTLFSVLFPVLILFPLFVLGLFGGADIKLFGMLGICFSFKDVMIIFAFSLFAGLIIGLIKVLITHSFGERFKYLFTYFKNLFVGISMKKIDVLDISFMETLDKETLSRGSVHYSLPILIATVTVAFIRINI